MIASRCSHHALLFAAHSVGVEARITPLSPSRGGGAPTRFRVKLYPITSGLYTPSWRRKRRDGLPIPAKYQRLSSNLRRLVHAVCWHGFRDYFRAVYRVEPDARFRTSFAYWKGADDFENRHPDSAYHNIGSNFDPCYIADACDC